MMVIKQRIIKYLHAERAQYVTQVESIHLKAHKTEKINTRKPDNYVFRPDTLCIPYDSQYEVHHSPTRQLLIHNCNGSTAISVRYGRNTWRFATLRRGFSSSTSIFPVSIIPPLLHTHLSIYHPRYIMFFSQYFSFPLSVSFHHCSIPIHPSTTNAV